MFFYDTGMNADQPRMKNRKISYIDNEETSLDFNTCKFQNFYTLELHKHDQFSRCKHTLAHTLISIYR